MYISKHFTYDANGAPLTVDFDYVEYMYDRTYDETTGTFLDDTEICYTISDTYYYITNIQGDVIELLNSDGESAGCYRYDAWGNIIDTLDNEDVIYYNPLRYRGYFQDPVSGYYYLQTRFYDPSVGRFIVRMPMFPPARVFLVIICLLIVGIILLCISIPPEHFLYPGL